MLRIACPWCGVRDEEEFQFGGESHVARPPAEASGAQWSDYLFNRTNPKGIHYERWCHSFGCSRWFNIARNTVTHEIVSVYRMGDRKPDTEAGT
jgi:sarcosine oxidase, subunit delta